jgi:hypothetical protein
VAINSTHDIAAFNLPEKLVLMPRFPPATAGFKITLNEAASRRPFVASWGALKSWSAKWPQEVVEFRLLSVF